MQAIQLEILKSIQSISSPFLDKLFEIATMLGEETFYILAFCFIYWCYSKMIGKQLILAFLLGNCLNTSLKEILHISRPIGEEGIRTLREHTATGYSFPSGHTQSTTTFFYFWMLRLKKYWFSLLSIIIILTVAFSRLYLGVHWPTDVIAAILISILVVHFGRWFFENITLFKVIISLIIINGLLFILSSKGYVTGAALFSSGLLGILLEEKFVYYKIKKSFTKNLLKLLIGLALVFAIKFGLKVLLPSSLIFDYIRYFLMGIWVSLGAMYTYKKLKL